MVGKETKLTPLAAKILEVLNAAPDQWVNRRTLAKRMGRPGTLTPYDVAILDELSKSGIVEIKQQSRGVVSFEWVYRAVQSNV